MMRKFLRVCRIISRILIVLSVAAILALALGCRVKLVRPDAAEAAKPEEPAPAPEPAPEAQQEEEKKDDGFNSITIE